MVSRTVSIITTEANDIMTNIHNNPKNPHRMPVILSKEMLEEWTTPFEPEAPATKQEKELIFDLTRSYQGNDLIYFTVPKLIGKIGVGNSEKAVERHDYIELSDLSWMNSSDRAW